MTEIKTELDAERIIAFYEGMTGGKANKDMIDMMVKGKYPLLQVRIAEFNGNIIGMRAFMQVLTPFGNKRGWALVEDLANGNEIEPDLTSPS